MPEISNGKEGVKVNRASKIKYQLVRRFQDFFISVFSKINCFDDSPHSMRQENILQEVKVAGNAKNRYYPDKNKVT